MTPSDLEELFNSLNIGLIDLTTKRKLDKNETEKILQFLSKKIDKQDLIEEIESIRFSYLIDYFLMDNRSQDAKFSFYIQHKKEINANSVKKRAFQKKFRILDFDDFLKEYRKYGGYPKIFYDDGLRESIIVEQHYKCGICEADIKYTEPHLHHIDYNKQNCDTKNLIFLCSRCHGKTNSNRAFWQNFLNEKKSN